MGGGGLGAVFALVVFGTRNAWPTHIDWLMAGEDAQHFLGWTFFRDEPWRLPLGRILRFGAPYGTSLTFTDAIPLMGLLFKPFATWLAQRTVSVLRPFGSFRCCALRGAAAAGALAAFGVESALVSFFRRRIVRPGAVVCVVGRAFFGLRAVASVVAAIGLYASDAGREQTQRRRWCALIVIALAIKFLTSAWMIATLAAAAALRRSLSEHRWQAFVTDSAAILCASGRDDGAPRLVRRRRADFGIWLLLRRSRHLREQRDGHSRWLPALGPRSRPIRRLRLLRHRRNTARSLSVFARAENAPAPIGPSPVPASRSFSSRCRRR